jgi:tetratricopeptide (TPR) repeat protein
MGQPTQAEIDDLIDRGIAAVEQDELDEAETILDDARGRAGENHVRVLHLAGLLAWARDDFEHATGYLMQAADLSPNRADIYLDCAECLFMGEETEEAEAQVRNALALPDITPTQRDEARLLLAQVRLADDDADEALEVLEAIDAELKEHPAFLSTMGAALLAKQQFEESIAALRAATEQEPDDADYRYQLGLALEAAGQLDESRQQMQRVLEMDAADTEPTTEPDYAEVQALRSRLEGVLEDLPDPVLHLVANAPITVQARPSAAQVGEGMNPRGVLCFTGRAARDGEEAELTGIVIMRDHLIGELAARSTGEVTDDDIEPELFYALLEEIQFFFKRDDLVVADA